MDPVVVDLNRELDRLDCADAIDTAFDAWCVENRLEGTEDDRAEFDAECEAAAEDAEVERYLDRLDERGDANY